MYKFVITIQLKPNTLDKILAVAPQAQAATRAEERCLAYDFFTCTDDPNKLVFIECFTEKAAHDFHMAQAYTQEFIAFHEQFHESLTFDVIEDTPAT